MKKSAALFIVLCLLPAAAPAAVDFTFLKHGARANAAGSAISTSVNDTYAVFYNPANLTSLTETETRFETARRLAPLQVGEASLVYVRPVPDTDGKVAALGYYAIRQGGGSSMDSLSMATGKRTVFKYLQMPLYYGTAFKLVSLRTPAKGQLGIGFDAGVRLEANSGLATALTLTDMTMGTGKSLATVTLGNSYRTGAYRFMADLKARGSYSEFFLGAEHDMFNGLLQARAGKGVALGKGRYLALGLGVNVLPWTIDLGWSIPWAGYNENSGYYGFTVGYRFGSRTFSEKLVGDAARQADTLKTQIDDLRVQRAALENSIATYRVNKGLLESDLTVMQGRMRETEANLKEVNLQLLEAQYKKEAPKPVKRYVPPPPERWPKLHKAAAGETLRSIAGKYYGNPNLWERIYSANEKNISKGLPVEGAILTIPPPPAGK
ncbi:MAG: hypothetical protein HY952_07765 [Elusimicrobia bacterium]|nr:hypothetical protein [Elusimicrobiota bacterium]